MSPRQHVSVDSEMVGDHAGGGEPFDHRGAAGCPVQIVDLLNGLDEGSRLGAQETGVAVVDNLRG